MLMMQMLMVQMLMVQMLMVQMLMVQMRMVQMLMVQRLPVTMGNDAIEGDVVNRIGHDRFYPPLTYPSPHLSEIRRFVMEEKGIHDKERQGEARQIKVAKGEGRQGR
jgi:hypothetical protein